MGRHALPASHSGAYDPRCPASTVCQNSRSRFVQSDRNDFDHQCLLCRGPLTKSTASAVQLGPRPFRVGTPPGPRDVSIAGWRSVGDAEFLVKARAGPQLQSTNRTNGFRSNVTREQATATGNVAANVPPQVGRSPRHRSFRPVPIANSSITRSYGHRGRELLRRLHARGRLRARFGRRRGAHCRAVPTALTDCGRR